MIDHETQMVLATDLIALFTVVLALVGISQAWLTLRTIRLARAEFISTHRPKIIVHSVELATDVVDGTDDATTGAQVVYFNVGSTPAKITEISCRITRRRLPLQSGIMIQATTAAPKAKIEGGGKGYIRAASEYRLEHERVVQKELLRHGDVVLGGDAEVRIVPRSNPNGGVVCIGRVTYEDERGVRRETGFCRLLDAAAERWTLADDSEYEYAY